MNNRSIFCSIGKTMKGIKPILESRFEQEGLEINLPQFIILNHLYNIENVILEDLSKILHTDKSGILRYIKQLENLSFVAKIVDSADKRRKVLHLTQKGITALNTARKIETELHQIVLSDIPESTVLQFKKTLEKIRKNTSEITNINQQKHLIDKSNNNE